jgi:hypothetical protein
MDLRKHNLPKVIYFHSDNACCSLTTAKLLISELIKTKYHGYEFNHDNNKHFNESDLNTFKAELIKYKKDTLALDNDKKRKRDDKNNDSSRATNTSTAQNKRTKFNDNVRNNSDQNLQQHTVSNQQFILQQLPIPKQEVNKDEIIATLTNHLTNATQYINFINTANMQFYGEAIRLSNENIALRLQLYSAEQQLLQYQNAQIPAHPTNVQTNNNADNTQQSMTTTTTTSSTQYAFMFGYNFNTTNHTSNNVPHHQHDEQINLDLDEVSNQALQHLNSDQSNSSDDYSEEYYADLNTTNLMKL